MLMVEDWSFMILEWWEGSFSKLFCAPRELVSVHYCGNIFTKWTLLMFSVLAPTSERGCWMYSTVFMRRIQTRLISSMNALNPVLWIFVEGGWWFVWISSSFLCHLLFITLKAKIFVQVLQAMIQMGVLVPTGDMTAIRRTAQFFLNRCFLSSKITSGFLFIF